METIQWSDMGSTREAAADDAARRYDRVCRESPKTTDTYWSALVPPPLSQVQFSLVGPGLHPFHRWIFWKTVQRCFFSQSHMKDAKVSKMDCGGSVTHFPFLSLCRGVILRRLNQNLKVWKCKSLKFGPSIINSSPGQILDRVNLGISLAKIPPTPKALGHTSVRKYIASYSPCHPQQRRG